ncbi:CAS/CSE protein involved in chromosome segregation [Serratia ficaria]|uniref:hypothetical protein n=1 Tax=Serratia ficaria TaxID=61651 RepID=UPI002182CB8E|nr:hypothetical protein [Serratia ficaria]CAI2536243.1 CAS/CSE protein involved in chromosome segregation [Serratia ficaria]
MKKFNYKLVALDAFKGRIFFINPNDYSTEDFIACDEETPDGVVFDAYNQRLYWTNMGKDYDAKDGHIRYGSLNGEVSGYTVKMGDTHTPKQLAMDADSHYLYWCDREGMKIERCQIATGTVEVLLDSSEMYPSENKESRYCIGIALDKKNNRIFWTMKGPSKGGLGRLLCAPFDYRAASASVNVNEVKVIFDKLPEPIDLAIDYAGDFLYWSDRGAEPDGNSLNRVSLSSLEDKDVVIRGFEETIGFVIDSENHCAFVADLTGHIYQIDLISQDKNVILYYPDSGFTGLARCG